MKRILLFLTVMVTVASCLGKSSFSQSYTLLSTFEYDYSYGYDYDKLFGTDSLYYDTEAKLGFGWDCLKYSHNVNKDTDEFEGGFVLSYLNTPKSGTADLANNQYRSCSLAPKTGHNTFVVFYQNPDESKNTDADIEFLSNDVGMCIVSHCVVNNTVAVSDAVKERFGAGDELKLKATGWLDGKETGSAVISLAKDTVMYNWTRFDLSKLGSVDKIDFEIISTKADIPAAVCMDDLTASISVSY